MDTSSKYNIPWELITDSFTGSLTSEEDAQLKQWLSAEPANNEKYRKIQELWTNRVEDYQFYKMANEKEAWKNLSLKLNKIESVTDNQSKIIEGQFTHRPNFTRTLIAVAAIFLGLIGIGTWFFFTSNKGVIHETAANEQKKVTLEDGSVITLQAMTKIEVSKDYNASGRRVIMASGEASFDVEHDKNKPFVVELGSTQINDLGTSFTIIKDEKKITVKVTSGKVNFEKLTTKESRELTAGTTLSFTLKNEKFGEIQPIQSSVKPEDLLHFNNTSLSNVISIIQKTYHKKIMLSDSAIANKKITATLNGMSYPLVLDVVCKSLNLEYSVVDSVYTLKEKK